MGASVQTTRTDPASVSQIRHLAGAALGIGFVVLVEAVRTAEPQLRAVLFRDAVWWPLLAIVGLFVLLGGVTVVAVLLAPRLPWLPTTAAALLGYGMIASLGVPVVDRLPHPGPWFPRADQGLTTLALLVGLMLIAAVWGWWSHRRHAAAGGVAQPPSGTQH
jgi:hypothetical protein